MDPTAEPVADLVARCVAALERGDATAVERLCVAHPDAAAEVRRRLQRLREAGLLGPAYAAPVDLESFGPYQVLRRLGSGGMGSVWLAEQERPVRRTVALKVMRAGVNSAELLARFELERQTLARMSHPHVAQLFDAGTTPHGLPYFAMEFVDGEPITAWADRHAMSAEERVRLVLPVLDAVQHAHQRGVIHRDLKPGNVLVAAVDGTPVPKVIDFGIAKMLDVADTDTSPGLTVAGSFLGTPEYMSPEQMRGAGADTRTDVFALGVMLYELLTGTLPVDGQRLRRAGHIEMLRILLEERPPTPSTRTTGIDDEARQRAESRSTTPTGLRRRLRGELDWIVMKAIDRDGDRRYATVKELADDLRRHLDGETVSAGPPSRWYRLRKVVARNKVASIAIAAGLVSLLVGLLAATTFASRAQRSSERALHRLGQAMAAVDRVLTEVGANRMVHVPLMQAVRRDVLRGAVDVLQELVQGGSDDDDPRLQRELAAAWVRLGRVHGLLGDRAEALRCQREALDRIDRLLPRLADPGDALVVRAMARIELAKIAPEPAERIALSEQAIATLQSPAAAGAADQRARLLALMNATHNLSVFVGSGERCVHLLQQSLAYRDELAGGDPTADLELAWKEVVSGSELGSELWLLGRGDDAIARLRASAEVGENLAARAPHRMDVRLAASVARSRLAVILFELSRYDDAVAAARAARDGLADLVADFPSVPDFQVRLAKATTELGRCLGWAGDTEEARRHIDDSIERHDTLVAEQPQHGPHRLRLLEALEVAVTAELQADEDVADLARAESALSRAQSMLDEITFGQPMGTEIALRRGALGMRAGALRARRGDHRAALACYRRVADDTDRALEQDPDSLALGVQLSQASANAAGMHLALDDGDASSREFARATGQLERMLRKRPQAEALHVAVAEALCERGEDLAHVRAHAASAELIADVDRLARAGNPRVLVRAAGVAAACIALAETDAELDPEAKRRCAARYAELAVALLRRAVDLGLADAAAVLERPPFAGLTACDPLRRELAGG